MTQFYHAGFRKAVVIFGSLFNDIFITRYDDNGIKTQDMQVPISYAPREKYLARVESDRYDKRDVATQLPRMSFEITGFDLMSEKQILPVNKIRTDQAYQYVGVPYRLTFELNIMTKYMEDGLQIVEQIIPYFEPRQTLKAKLLDDVDDYITAVPITLNSTTLMDTYEADFVTRRAIIFTLTFTMEIPFFGPKRESKVIKFATVNTYTDPEMRKLTERVTVQPGLTANGEPTSDINNTIAYLDIKSSDNYGFIVRVYEE